MISIADDVNIMGHSLNGRKLILNPVNNDMTVRIIRQADDDRYTAVDIMFCASIAVVIATRDPININAMPSIIHSMAMILRLSVLISPKP